MDDIFDESGDEEEQDAVVSQVLDEIGIEISGKVCTPVIAPGLRHWTSTVVIEVLLNVQTCCSTSGPVTTWMGDCLLTGKPLWYVPNHLGQLSFPSLRVGKLSNGLSSWG